MSHEWPKDLQLTAEHVKFVRTLLQNDDPRFTLAIMIARSAEETAKDLYKLPNAQRPDFIQTFEALQTMGLQPELAECWRIGFRTGLEKAGNKQKVKP